MIQSLFKLGQKRIRISLQTWQNTTKFDCLYFSFNYKIDQSYLTGGQESLFQDIQFAFWSCFESRS